MLMNTNAGTFEINIGQFHNEFTVAEPGIELFMSFVVSTNTLDVIDDSYDRYEFLSIWHIYDLNLNSDYIDRTMKLISIHVT